MPSTMELDSNIWQMFEDADGRVEKSATEALSQIGWDKKIMWARVAHRRGSGMIDARCTEIWCVHLADVGPEVRHCLSMRDADPHGEMVKKFARTFEALRSGRLSVETYEGMEAANAAQERFEATHRGHRTDVDVSRDNLIVTRCYDCDAEFREHYTPAKPPERTG